MKKYLLTLGILLFAGAASQSALADTFYLDSSNTTLVPCNTTAPCAEVMISTSGNVATFTVSSLDSGYVFDTFGFNFTGAGSLTLSGAATGEVASGYSLSGPGSTAQDGYGKFDYIFNTKENGGSHGTDCVVTGGVPGGGCTFTFSLTDSSTSSLSASEFEALSSGGNSTDYAGHLAAGGGNTGYVGDAVASVVPEPSSLMLLGSGVLGLAGVVRRKFRG